MKDYIFSDIPYFLKANDAVFYFGDIGITQKELSSLMPAGTKLLFFSSTGWNLVPVPISHEDQYTKTTAEYNTNADKIDDSLFNLLGANDIERLVIFTILPEIPKNKLKEMAAHKDFKVIEYELKSKVQESDFMTGDEKEEFEKRLKELGYF